MKTSFHHVRSTRYAAVGLMISALTVVQACSSDASPTAPNSVTSGSTAERRQVRISGIVTDEDGAAVAGVTINVYLLGTNQRFLSVVSDQTGFYTASLSSGLDIMAFTVKEGFVSAWHNHSIGAADFRWDLVIYRTPKTSG